MDHNVQPSVLPKTGMSLLNKRKLKDAAMYACVCSGISNKNRVGQSFIDHIESEVRPESEALESASKALESAIRKAIAKRVNHHDNKTGARKTLE